VAPLPAAVEEPIYEWMTGSFNSSLQSNYDSSYYNISLHMTPIWENKAGNYIYVEQALNSKQESPYRVRVYELLELEDGTFESKVYKLSNEEDCIGHHDNPQHFDQFDVNILEEREGCSVFLTKLNKHYVGSTKEKMCKSTMRGASYATSIVRVYSDRIESWDQGFDAEGKQVWGAEKGGYVFNRINTKSNGQ